MKRQRALLGRKRRRDSETSNQRKEAAEGEEESYVGEMRITMDGRGRNRDWGGRLQRENVGGERKKGGGGAGGGGYEKCHQECMCVEDVELHQLSVSQSLNQACNINIRSLDRATVEVETVKLKQVS